jgi:hypothetical protein
VTAAAVARVAAAVALDPYDYASQALDLRGSVTRLASFNAMISEVRAATEAADRLRVQRIEGALERKRGFPDQGETYVNLRGKPCPPSGALAYVWADVFATAKENLRRLSETPPPRYIETGYEIMDWTAMIRWNHRLLLDALNIRDRFLFPSVEQTQHTMLSPNWDMSSPPNELPPTQGFDYATGASTLISTASTRDALGRGYKLYLFDESARFGRYVLLDSALTERGVLVPGPRGSHIFSTRPRGGGEAGEEDRLRSQYRMALSRAEAGILASIREMGNIARWFSRIDLMRTIFDASAFYVLNYIPFWQQQGYLSMNSKDVKEAQVAALNSAFQSGTPGMITSAVTSIIGRINPAMSFVTGILSSAGNVLMEQFVFRQLDMGRPMSFWVRVPGDPSCVTSSTIEDEGRMIAVQRAVLNLSLGRLPDLSFLPRVAVGTSTSTSTGTSTAEGGGGTTTAISTPLTAASGSGGGGGGSGALLFGAGAAVLYFLMRRN